MHKKIKLILRILYRIAGLILLSCRPKTAWLGMLALLLLAGFGCRESVNQSGVQRSRRPAPVPALPMAESPVPVGKLEMRAPPLPTVFASSPHPQLDRPLSQSLDRLYHPSDPHYEIPEPRSETELEDETEPKQGLRIILKPVLSAEETLPAPARARNP